MAKLFAALLAALFSKPGSGSVSAAEIAAHKPEIAAAAERVPPRPPIVKLRSGRPFPRIRGVIANEMLTAVWIHAGQWLCLDPQGTGQVKCGLCRARILRKPEALLALRDGPREQLVLIGPAETGNDVLVAIARLQPRIGTTVEFGWNCGRISMQIGERVAPPPIVDITAHVIRWAQRDWVIESRQVSPPEGGDS